MTNVLEDQYIMYCGATAAVFTLSYRNVIIVGSIASPPSTASLISTTTSTISSGILTSATSSSLVTLQATSSPSQTSTLSKGAIAGISIASFFFIALLATLLFLFCIRPKLARKRQIKYAGGFSTNNNDKGTPSTGPLGSLNDLVHGRRRKRWGGGREGAASGGGVGGLGISEADYSSVPWSPTTITANSPSELPDEPLPSPSPQRSPVAAQGSPTVRHVVEQASSSAAPAAGNPHSPAYPYVHVNGVPPQDSMPVSELSSLMTGSSSPQMTISSLGVSRPPSDSTYRRLSARGGGRGYVSPEMALADGWQDDGEEGEEENGEGYGGPAELEGGEIGNGNGKRGSKGSGNMERIEEEGGGTGNRDTRSASERSGV